MLWCLGVGGWLMRKKYKNEDLGGKKEKGINASNCIFLDYKL